MLTDNQKKHLRRLGHPLHPVILIGNAGLTDGVVAETDRALGDHELVKVRARFAERGDRDAALAELTARTGAELVQRIGHVALLYRQRPEPPRIELPGD